MVSVVRGVTMVALTALSPTFCFRVSIAVTGVSETEGAMFKGRDFDRSVILLCVRWYLAYSLGLRNLEEMMAERGISVDHATIHKWIVRYSPDLLEQFNRHKRPVTGRWHVSETYIKVRGEWRYLYPAIDSHGGTVEFWFSKRRAVPPRCALANLIFDAVGRNHFAECRTVLGPGAGFVPTIPSLKIALESLLSQALRLLTFGQSPSARLVLVRASGSDLASIAALLEEVRSTVRSTVFSLWMKIRLR
jgi:hypothetical protein